MTADLTTMEEMSILDLPNKNMRYILAYHFSYFHKFLLILARLLRLAVVSAGHAKKKFGLKALS